MQKKFAYLEVARAMDDLVAPVGESGVPLRQHALHPDDEGALQLNILSYISGLGHTGVGSHSSHSNESQTESRKYLRAKGIFTSANGVYMYMYIAGS